MVLPRPPSPGSDVVFEIGVAARDLAHTVDCRLGERRSAEVRVHDHAGRVENPAEARGSSGVELGLQLHSEIARIVTLLYLFTRTRDHGARRFDGERVLALARQFVHGRKVAQPHCQRLLRD